MTAEHRTAPDPAIDEPTDPDLIAVTRTGDPGAIDVLYRRHVRSARRLAQALTGSATAADRLVVTSFARVLHALRVGRGPDSAFRPYLLTTMRRANLEPGPSSTRSALAPGAPALGALTPGTLISSTLTSGVVTHGAMTHGPLTSGALIASAWTRGDGAVAVVARAFGRLPERWRLVLWHTAVDAEGPADVAPLLGLSPHAVDLLAHRAREGLRQRYLQEHLAQAPEDCRWAVHRSGEYTRGSLSKRDSGHIDGHLAECSRCHALFVDLAEPGARQALGALLAHAVLGAAADGYLAALARPSTAVGHPPAPARVRDRILARTPAPTRVRHRPPSRTPTGRTSLRTAAAGAAVVATVLALMTAFAAHPHPPDPTEATSGRPGPVGPAPVVASPTASPAGNTAVLDARLEPVGALVRGRPGVLALTVAHLAGTGVRQRTPATGPLTALLVLPTGVTLRARPAAGDWACTTAHEGIRCVRPALPPGTTSRAYVPVSVSYAAAAGVPAVRLSAPHAVVHATEAREGIQSVGLSAVMATTAPAGIAIGGNSLLSCTARTPACTAARAGRPLPGHLDNGDFPMAPYVAPGAPPGVPPGAAVSDAEIRLAGPVIWAGLYWAGTGSAPGTSTAYLQIPGTTGYAAVPATRVDDVTTGEFGQPAYQASADVTTLVQHTAGGRWWVAVPPGSFTAGVNTFGGWALMVIVNNGGRMRTVAIFDGCTSLRGTESFSSALYNSPASARSAGPSDSSESTSSGSPGSPGLSGPGLPGLPGSPGSAGGSGSSGSSGPSGSLRSAGGSGSAGGVGTGVLAQIGFIGWEGDRGISGDRLKLGGEVLGTQVHGVGAPGDRVPGGTAVGEDGNIASSHTDGTPPGWNTFGVDARVLTGHPADSHPLLAAITSGDAWLLGALALIT
jgi:DNA-directed RNA polymerase specialized sigma24 family protein